MVCAACGGSGNGGLMFFNTGYDEKTGGCGGGYRPASDCPSCGGAGMVPGGAQSDLLSANAAMLQRWAVLFNLFESEGDLRVDAILGVAELSAREFVLGGPEYGGERLLRQEAAARALIVIKETLDKGEAIIPGDESHVFVMRSVAQLSSYPGAPGSPG